MIRKSVGILAVLGLCACGPDLEAGEGNEVTSQALVYSSDAASTLSVVRDMPVAPQLLVPTPPTPPLQVWVNQAPTLPLDPMPLTVVRPGAPLVQQLAPIN